MPTDIENTLETELQVPVQDEAEVPAQAGAEPSADAGSSPATDVSKTAEPDTLSIVRDVVEKRGDGTAVASSATGEETGAKPGETQPTKGEDDFSDVPFNKHPRFQEVLSELKAAKTDAVRYRNVQGFLDAEGLTGEDAANGLTLLARTRRLGLDGDEMADGLAKLALCKTDPVQGFEAIRPWLQNLLVAAGAVLPGDLQQRVQAGEISPDLALEQSRIRAQLQAQQAQQTFAQQRAAVDQQTAASRALQEAAGSWETERHRKDPNFASKLPAVVEEVRRLQSHGWMPSKPQDVTEQLNRAYSTVNGRLGAGAANAARAVAAPAPAQRRPLQPITGGQVAGNAAATPQSTMDHVARVLSKRQAG